MPPGPRRTTFRRDLVEVVAALLARSRSALFITGAGISADSGLPTYRGIGGLYRDRNTEHGIPIEVALSGEMLARRPQVTWRHIAEIEAACRGARPNRGHQVLAALERRLARTLVLTQNVDGLHRAAGSTRVVEIHGRVHRLRCVRCDFATEVDDFAGIPMPPACPQCGALVRPAVVLFGEALDPEPCAALEDELAAGFDIVFAIGTTAMFPYIARPVLLAKALGIPTVEINPGRTALSDLVDIRLRAGAARALTAIWASYVGR